MVWKGFTNARDRMFGAVADRVIRLAACDLMLLKVGEKHISPKKNLIVPDIFNDRQNA